MQKIFRRYTVFIITTAILSIFFINLVITMYSFQKQQFNAFSAKIDQIIHTLENNQTELETIKNNLDEDYLTRARAAAYIFERNKDIVYDVLELKELAALLDVDELHIIDKNGIIIYSSVSRYIGLDFHKGEQTREFLTILESDDKDAYVIQEAQPNTAEGKIMKYVGVARKGEEGIVQVGLEPVRQLEAQARNTYAYIFSRFPTDVGEEFFAIDCESSEVLGHSGKVSEEDLEKYYQIDRLKDCGSGKFIEMEGAIRCYTVTRQYDGVLIGVLLPENVFFLSIWHNAVTTLVYLMIIEIILVVLINFLVQYNVLDRMNRVLQDLERITNGNLDTVVSVGGSPEFEELSNGINAMVKSIVNTTDSISQIIEMSEIPLAAFKYQSNMKYVFVSSGLGDLIYLSAKELDRLCINPELFYQKMQEIMKNTVEGEKDVFQIKQNRFVRIHLSLEPTDYMGAVTDVTGDILEKQRMKYENSHDQLTGLFKYRYFQEQIEEIRKKAQVGKVSACVMLDLDAFKSINDTYGHDSGDRYLLSFAGMLKELPKEHCLTARRSGDEFCIYVYDCDSKEEVLSILDSFWETLKERQIELLENRICIISASGGVAWVEDENMELTVLLKRGDEALYEAKRKDKGRYEEYITDREEQEEQS